jgi:hypothetical protein
MTCTITPSPHQSESDPMHNPNTITSGVPLLPSDTRFRGTPAADFYAVSTILFETEVLSPALQAWRDRQTPEQLADVERKKSAGAERGRKLDDMLERWGTTGEEGEGVWWEAIRPSLSRIRQVHAVQLPIYHVGLRYRGKLDVIADWQTASGEVVPAVIDYKSAAKRKKPEWVADKEAQQLGSYFAALREMLVRVRGLQIEHGALVFGIEGSKRPQVFEYSLFELVEAFELFEARALIYLDRMLEIEDEEPGAERAPLSTIPLGASAAQLSIESVENTHVPDGLTVTTKTVVLDLKPPKPLEPIRTGGCRSCPATIGWIRSASGKAIPVDLEPVAILPESLSFAAPRGVKRTIVTDAGEVRVGVACDNDTPGATLGRVSHFASCPGAKRHRKAKGEPKAAAS